jgi:hypothetical protein
MLKSGILIVLGALVGLLLTHVVIVANFLRRMPPGQLAMREFLAVLLTGGIGKDYMTLLAESHIEPTHFERILSFIDKILAWVFILGLVIAIIGLIVTINSCPRSEV